MLYRVSKFSLFILSGFMAIIISMPSAHAVLIHANSVTESSTLEDLITAADACSTSVAATSDGDKANVYPDGNGNYPPGTLPEDKVNALDSAYCFETDLDSAYEITYTFNTSIHEKMDSITIWSNGGAGYGDDELRMFNMEVDYIKVDGTSGMLTMTNVDIGATGSASVSKSVNFKIGTSDVELLKVSEIRLFNLRGKDASGPPIFRELQLNVEPVDNVLVTTITSDLDSDYADIGTVILYEIEVQNLGTDVAHDVSLTSLLPSGFTPDSQYNGLLSTAYGSYNHTDGKLSGLVVDPDDSEFLYLEGSIKNDQKGNTIITSTTAADNSANDATDTTDDVLSNSVTVPDPKLTISASAVPTTNAAAGNTITYTYTVTNNGNVPLNDVGVTINSAVHNGSGPAPVAASESITPAGGTSGNSTDNGSNGTWDVLAVGDEVTFTGSYTVTQTDMDTLP